MPGPPPAATLYARPTAFIDAPFGFDGHYARLAGGLQFFAAWEMIAIQNGQRSGSWLVPVDQVAPWLATVGPDQAARLTEMMARATTPRAALQMGSRTIRMDQPNVMGILNITPDSFSGGSAHLHDPAGSAALAVHMAEQGAAIIDLGGESTRPGAAPVWEQDELDRVLPVLELLKETGLALSLDTRKAAVMEAGLVAGAHLINDVSALLFDERALDVVTRSGALVVLMHYPGKPSDPHGNDSYGDPLTEIYDWLEARIDAVVAAGVARERIVADPGIGFGKRSVGDNLKIMNGLALFHGLGVPLLLGASRKRLIGALSNEAPTTERLGGSITLALKAAEQGAQIIRVHDVFETAQALRVWRGHRDVALSPA